MFDFSNFNSVVPDGGGAVGGNIDFSSLLTGGSGGGFDFSGLVSGATQVAADANSGMDGSDVAGLVGGGAGAAIGSLLLPGAGTALGGTIGKALGSLFGGKHTDSAAQSAAINAIAATNGITGDEAGAVVSYHANNSSDHFNDLAEYCATDNGRFLQLVSEYNAANPGSVVTPGSVTKAVAAKQQAVLSAAVASPGFANTATGQALVSQLQNMDSSALVGTSNMTAGDYLGQILKGAATGAQKGAADAAAATPVGQQFKASYIKDWINENQLAAAGIAGFTLFGVVELFKKFSKGGRISL